MKSESVVPKINIFLSLSSIALVVYLALVSIQPYSPGALSGKDIKLEASKLMAKESSAVLEGNYAFDEKIFKKKQLFGQSAKIKLEPEKQAFLLLGVSVGDRNLAMIRDVTENKDYYCVQGDRIGNFQVKEILKDKVILESEGNILEINQ